MKSKLNYKLIEKAISGDKTSIDRIISIYQPYINTLASRTVYDADGNEFIGVNVELKDHLTRKLFQVIHSFKINS